jgi:hypothetical protein
MPAYKKVNSWSGYYQRSPRVIAKNGVNTVNARKTALFFNCIARHQHKIRPPNLGHTTPRVNILFSLCFHKVVPATGIVEAMPCLDRKSFTRNSQGKGVSICLTNIHNVIHRGRWN